VSLKDKFCPECGNKLGEPSLTVIPRLEDMHTQLQCHPVLVRWAFGDDPGDNGVGMTVVREV